MGTYFVSLVPLLPSRTQVRFFTSVLNKWWARQVIQVLGEYQVLNFEMAISFELRPEYVNYAYHWNRQGIESEKWQMKSIRFNFETLIIPFMYKNQPVLINGAAHKHAA